MLSRLFSWGRPTSSGESRNQTYAAPAGPARDSVSSRGGMKLFRTLFRNGTSAATDAPAQVFTGAVTSNANRTRTAVDMTAGAGAVATNARRFRTQLSRRGGKNAEPVSPSSVLGTVNGNSSAMYRPLFSMQDARDVLGGRTTRSDASLSANVGAVSRWAKELEQVLLGFYKAQGLTPIVNGLAFSTILHAKKLTIEKVLADKRAISFETMQIIGGDEIAKYGVVPLAFSGVTALVDNGWSQGAHLSNVCLWFVGIQDMVKMTFAPLFKERDPANLDAALVREDLENPQVLRIVGDILSSPVNEAAQFAWKKYWRLLVAVDDPEALPYGMCEVRNTVLQAWMTFFEEQVKEAVREYDRKQRISTLTLAVRMPDSRLSANTKEYIQDEMSDIDLSGTVLSQMQTRQIDGDQHDEITNTESGSDGE